MKIEINENRKWMHSFTLKIALLCILGLFLLIPLEMIKSIIKERQKTSENIKKEIAWQWAGQQTVTGPVLNIPVMVFPLKSNSDPRRSVFHIMPETLEITGSVQTEKRHKSIYQSVVYTADLIFSGEFKIPEILPGDKIEILWKETYYSLGISDNRGVKDEVKLVTDSLEIDAVPGLSDSEIFNSGITFPVSIQNNNKNISYSLTLKLSGSERLNFSPVGKTTSVNLKSSWNAPGFIGSFLPVERSINDSGFNARWAITNLNRNFPQYWNGTSYNPSNEYFGVEFVLLVDHYQKSLRSAKYGVLFIALTFMALLFTEFAGKNKLHVFHYLLVSLALVLFFSLLNALSEHIGFNLAYLVSSASTIILITLFLRTLIGNYRPVFLLSGLLVFLYSFIFILLTLNDYAYLAGNIGLFILLAVTMRLSVKLRLFNGEHEPEIPDQTNSVK